jgi:hypothetical protein
MFTGSMNEFMERVLTAFPNAEVKEDSEGQLIVHTNCYQKGDDSINNNNYVQEYLRHE